MGKLYSANTFSDLVSLLSATSSARALQADLLRQRWDTNRVNAVTFLTSGKERSHLKIHFKVLILRIKPVQPLSMLSWPFWAAQSQTTAIPLDINIHQKMLQRKSLYKSRNVSLVDFRLWHFTNVDVPLA